MPFICIGGSQSGKAVNLSPSMREFRVPVRSSESTFPEWPRFEYETYRLEEFSCPDDLPPIGILIPEGTRIRDAMVALLDAYHEAESRNKEIESLRERVRELELEKAKLHQAIREKFWNEVTEDGGAK